MNFLRILKSIAQGIVLGLRYAHPTYMYICVLRKSFKIQSNYVTLLFFVSPQRYKYLTVFMFTVPFIGKTLRGMRS